MRGIAVEDELYRRPNPFGILNDFVRPETHDSPTVTLHVRSTTCIRALLKRMVITIDLDHELPGYTGEVREVRTDRMLSAELGAADPAAS